MRIPAACHVLRDQEFGNGTLPIAQHRGRFPEDRRDDLVTDHDNPIVPAMDVLLNDEIPAAQPTPGELVESGLELLRVSDIGNDTDSADTHGGFHHDWIADLFHEGASRGE